MFLKVTGLKKVTKEMCEERRAVRNEAVCYVNV